MSSLDQVFEGFFRYVMPFLLLATAYQQLRRRPRTRGNLIWGILTMIIGVWGLVLLVGP